MAGTLESRKSQQLPSVLASLWRWWAEHATTLTAEQLATPTRCGRWTVHELLAHAAPDPDRLATVLANPVDAEPAVADAAAVLRAFNVPGGLAQSMADTIAANAAAAAPLVSAAELARRFDKAAAVVDAAAYEPTRTLPYPGVGTLPAAALTQLAIVEGAVHGLDLVAAVGGDLPPAEARSAALGVLVRIPDDAVLLDVLTGRADPAAILPLMR